MRRRRRNPSPLATQFFLSVAAGVVTSLVTVFILHELGKVTPALATTK